MSGILPQRPVVVYPGPPVNSPQEIRVLEIQDGEWNDEICCRLPVQQLLSNPDFDDSLPYTALSYTWATWTNHTTISLNGQSGFPITANLWNALRRFREGQTALATRAMWIDQICIDQQTAERNEHVKIMGQIHQQAERVLIWLADGGEEVVERMKIKAKHEYLLSAVTRTDPP